VTAWIHIHCVVGWLHLAAEKMQLCCDFGIMDVILPSFRYTKLTLSICKITTKLYCSSRCHGDLFCNHTVLLNLTKIFLNSSFLLPLNLARRYWEALQDSHSDQRKMTAGQISWMGPNTLGPHDLQSWKRRVTRRLRIWIGVWTHGCPGIHA